MIRILLADDHTIVRQGLRKILSEFSDLDVAGEASNADEVMAQVREHPFDVIVLDISMPGKSGIEIIADIRNENPRASILILSMMPEEQFAKRALRAGASGYMTKGSAPEEFIRAIRQIHDGRKYISPALAEYLASDLGDSTDRPPHEALSAREFQVLLQLASGKSISEIARQLSLSAKTVTTYRTRILEKMKLKSNADLTRYSIEHHLLT